MKKTSNLFKTLLVAAVLSVGSTSAWGDVTETIVVNCDFNSGETLFTGVSRITVDNDNNARFTGAKNAANVYALATYDFSSAIGEDATAIKVEFAYYIPNSNANYYRFFTLGQSDLRTGFAQYTYPTAGALFGLGLKRGKWNGAGSNVNFFSVNNGYTSQTGENVLGAWARAEVYIDFSTKKISYKITNVENTETYFSADNLDYMDGTASYCNQIDFYDCANSQISYLDNLVITKYKDNSKEPTTYTVKYQNASGDDLKDPVVYDTYVGDTYTASASDMATFYNGDSSVKYVYASGNTSTAATSTAASNVITLVFNEYDKVAYTVTAKNGEDDLTTLASGNAYTDGSTTVLLNKYIKVSDSWYMTSETSFKKVITAAGNTDVAYSPADIAYFFEMENLTRSGGAYLTEESASYSNNARLRLSRGSTYYTPALAGGVYHLSIGCVNSNASSNEVYVYTRSAGGVLSDKLHTHTAATGTTTLSYDITVPYGYSIAFNGNEGGSANNNARMDYMTLEKVSDAVGLIGLNGNWAEDILMTHSEGAVYTTTVEGFAAKAGINYEYKIRDYGTWDSFQFPATGLGNKSFSVAEDGIYTLTFTADISTGAVTVGKTRTADYANVVTLVNVAGWDKDNVYAYAWTGDEENAAWPGLQINKVGTFQGYDVFAYSYETKHDKIIFNNNSAQTADLTFTDGEQYSNGTIQPYYSVTYTNPGSWSNVYAYTWTTKGGSDENAAWPGIAMTPTEAGYVYAFHTDGDAPTKIIFNDNGSNQTDNLKFYNGLTYSFDAKGSTVPVTISSAGYATYASAATLNFAESGITAYRATESDGTVTFSEQSWVPAGTGLLLKAEPGTYNVPTATSDDEDYAVSSALVGVVKATRIDDAGIFVLMNGASGVGFYKTTSAFTVGANTAYIPALPVASRFIAINGVEEVTGVRSLTPSPSPKGDGSIYNLGGQRISLPTKGLYIVNGKKVSIK